LNNNLLSELEPPYTNYTITTPLNQEDQTNEVNLPLDQNFTGTQDSLSLGDILLGDEQLENPKQRPSLFSVSGPAFQDVATSHVAYTNALDTNQAYSVDLN
jgi:ornithine cyclodeaminase/alanine dehydrogenase-like protein (mu-crystallin family)